MAVGQKDANPWGPQVDGSIFPFTNKGFFGYPFLTHSHMDRGRFDMVMYRVYLGILYCFPLIF